MSKGPLELVGEIAAMLDDLGIPYALGGSLASSVVGEPRATVDVDVAIEVGPEKGNALIDRAATAFYVPTESARDAIGTSSSFHLIDIDNGLKVDLFVLGQGLLDRMQIERRIRLSISGIDREIWVTSPEDQILRKLDWYRSTGHESERQWRDVVAIIRIQGEALDRDYLRETALPVGLGELLDQATAAAGDDSGFLAVRAATKPQRWPRRPRCCEAPCRYVATMAVMKWPHREERAEWRLASESSGTT